VARKKVFVTRPIFPETLDTLHREVDVSANDEDRVLSKPELMRSIGDRDGVIALVTDRIDREVLEGAPHLKVVSNYGVGVNNIDLEAATGAGVLVTNTPGVLTETTADLAWALMMAAARRVVEADRFVRSKEFKAWGPTIMLGYDIHGKTLGIIGFGRIGQAVAKRARGFDMTILYYEPSSEHHSVAQLLGAKRVALEEIYRRSDFISLHVPLLTETHRLFDDRAFAMMKPSCIIVNTSRGPVVDEKALVRALRTRRIAGAALDVFEAEPFIEPELLEMDNVVLAPHIGSASYDTRMKMSSIAVENLLVALRGHKPPNLVNEDVWDRRRP